MNSTRRLKSPSTSPAACRCDSMNWGDTYRPGKILLYWSAVGSGPGVLYRPGKILLHLSAVGSGPGGLYRPGKILLYLSAVGGGPGVPYRPTPQRHVDGGTSSIDGGNTSCPAIIELNRGGSTIMPRRHPVEYDPPAPTKQGCRIAYRRTGSTRPHPRASS